ncbi:MAG TPA: DUF6599 family protein, partial [Acidobacteriota bacterium]
LCTVLLFAAMMPAQVDEAAIFPAVVRGWELAPATETYTRENLYQYIDGAAELYISYGFRRLLARRYEKENQPEIVADLFDMRDPGNAYGIFAHSQENPGLDIGEDGEYLDGLLRFRQGRYYVSLLASPETPESRLAILELGRKLAGRLGTAAGRPPVLALLPEKGLIAPSVRYFRHPAWQNTYVFISAENILDIGPDTQALLARYDQGEQRPVVLVVVYPARAAAARAFANFSRIFKLPGRGQALQLADNKYLAALVEGKMIAAVWHGGGAAPCIQLLAAVREKIAAFKK